MVILGIPSVSPFLTVLTRRLLTIGDLVGFVASSHGYLPVSLLVERLVPRRVEGHFERKLIKVAKSSEKDTSQQDPTVKREPIANRLKTVTFPIRK